MWGVKSIKLVDYLCSNGVFPEYESLGVTFFKTTAKFRELKDKYYLEIVCIPNRVGVY